MGDSEQVEVLRLIWQELKDLGQNLGGRIDETNRRIDETNRRLESEITLLRRELRAEIAELRRELKEENAELRRELKEENAELRRSMVESDMRLATEVTALAQDVRTLLTQIVESRVDGQRIWACEARIEALDRRVSLIERE